jgi:hypothetical protein
MQTLTKENLQAVKGGATYSKQISFGGNNYTVQIDTTQRQLCIARIIPPANPFQAPPRPLPICIKF